MRLIFRLVMLFAVFAFAYGNLTLGQNAAQAQLAHVPKAPAEEETEGLDLQAIMDQAKEKDLSVIVITPGAEEEKAAPKGPSLRKQLVKARGILVKIFGSAPRFFQSLSKTLTKASQDGTFNWLWYSIAIAVGGIIAGTIPTLFTRKWLRNYVDNRQAKKAEESLDDPDSRVVKVSFLMFRAFVVSLNVIIMTTIAFAFTIIFDLTHGPSYWTVFFIIMAYATYRIFQHVILFNLLAPEDPQYRTVNLSDMAAHRLQNTWRVTSLYVITVCTMFMWLWSIGMPGYPLRLFVIFALASSALIIGCLFWRQRREFADILLGGGDPLDKAAWRRYLASNFHIFAAIYLVAALTLSVYRVTLLIPGGFTLASAPILALIGSIVVYGFSIILIERFYGIRKRRFDSKQKKAMAYKKAQYEAEQKKLEEMMANRSEDDDEEIIINKMMSPQELEEMPIFKPVFKSLFEEAIGVLVTIVSIGWIFTTWKVSIPGIGNPITSFLGIIIIVFFAWLMYRMVIAYVNHVLEEEGEDALEEEGEPGDEMTGKSASRMATLLPLLKNVLIVTIFTLAGMLILTNLGVDIAPLFAGAGVIGLAVGFGAQTLIRDIFSGGFFLFDDAFRRGEYIELDNIRGTVEKISLRSFQLRHHNGPLHTIPFGEIKQLTNYSRDWVMMKLPLRVTYDTDVERVRKLVKKLGQRLLDHPDVGSLFLQPLKSQGVYKMEDSAMIIRIKFMTKPGDQFVTRKVVYAAIRELFENEGIRFASKEVTVRIEHDDNGHATEETEDTLKKAAAAAARRVQDDDEAAAKGAAPEADLP